MKKIARFRALIIAAVFCLSMVSPAMTFTRVSAGGRTNARKSTPNVRITLPDDPEAIFDSARVIHNVTVRGQKGMRVHAKFHVRYGKDVACMMIAYFYFDDDGPTPLKTSDPTYRAKDGTVSATSNFTPGYDYTDYNDLQLFVPYDALNMQEGDEYELKFYLALYDKEGERFFGKSPLYKFHLTVPGE
jgi:hypothetical protein